MKTSFSTLACPEWNLAQVINAATRYGFDGIELRVLSHELDLWTLPEFARSNLTTTRRSIEESGLQVVSLGSSANFHSPDRIERERNIEIAVRMAELAADIGALSVRVFPDCIQDCCSREQTEAWIAESLNSLACRLASSGVELWLETHGDFSSAAAWTKIADQMDAPNFGIIWDPANAFLHNGELPELPVSCEQCIRHVHLKDLSRDGTAASHYVLTGEGDFPFDTMFTSLHAIGYDRFISLEWERHWHPELAAADIALPHFIEWWRRKGGN